MKRTTSLKYMGWVLALPVVVACLAIVLAVTLLVSIPVLLSCMVSPRKCGASLKNGLQDRRDRAMATGMSVVMQKSMASMMSK